MSQKDLSAKIGVNRVSLARWERNPAILKRVPLETLERLAKALSPLPTGEPVTIDHLIGRQYIPGFTPPELQELNKLLLSGQVQISNYDGTLRLYPPAGQQYAPEVAEWVEAHGDEALRQWQVHAAARKERKKA